MKKQILISTLGFLLTPAMTLAQDKPYEYMDNRPLLKVNINSCSGQECQILIDIIGQMFFDEFRVGDHASSQNLSAQKQQISEEQDNRFYGRGRGRKATGYFQSADFTLNVSVQASYASPISRPAISYGGIARRMLSGYGQVITEEYVYRVPVTVTMALEANGDDVVVQSVTGKAVGYSENWNWKKVFTISSYGSFSSYEEAVMDGVVKAAAKAKAKMQPM